MTVKTCWLAYEVDSIYQKGSFVELGLTLACSIFALGFAVYLAKWVLKNDDGTQGVANFQLTDDGRRHHGIILTAQKQARERVVQGISEEEYTTVIRVLQRIISNLPGEAHEKCNAQ